jgi:DNA-directed RNA polymerase subunit RPC12/RpoP
VKFSCERCGKKYATADPPSPGKVYKLKCKACGHLIVVRASASTGAKADAAGTAAATPAPPPSLEIPDLPQASGRSEAAAASPNGAPAAAPQIPGDETSQVAIGPPGEEPTPPSADPGYVDLFSDLSVADGGEAAPQDPLSAAARASLPESYGSAGAAPDPLAPLAQELAEARAAQPAASIPKVPVIPEPPPHKQGLPLALIGGGVVVLVGILGFVLLGFGKKPAPPHPRPVQAAPLPAQDGTLRPPPPPEPVRAEAPAPSPPAAEAQPPAAPPRASDDRRREERRRRSREEAQAQAQAAREAKQRERRAREERERSERERKERERLTAAAAQQESEGLTQAQIESVLRSTRKAFDACLASARGTEPKLDGRRVLLRLNIQPSGTVTYPTLDDVTLSGTDLGSCLKSSARLMVFPRFKGETLHVEVPLVMR